MLDNSNNPMSDTDIKNLAGWTSGYMGYTNPNDYVAHLEDMYLMNWIDAFDADVSSGDWSGTGNIRIMNLSKYAVNDGTLTPTHYAQDQLVRVTPELPTVYSAGAVIGCAVLWGFVGVVRKQRPFSRAFARNCQPAAPANCLVMSCRH
jgi:hypothetical protein